MTRDDAINYVLDSARCIIGEFSTSQKEDEEIMDKAFEALEAFGVTREKALDIDRR
jgi:hypothetical protein